MLNNTKIGALKLLAKFIFKLDGVLLKIQYGKIQAVLAGKCSGAASISYEGVTLEERKITEFDLPGEVNLTRTRKEEIADEIDNADDILTEPRVSPPYDLEVITREEIATAIPISFGKKLFLMIIGILIALLLIATTMLLL